MKNITKSATWATILAMTTCAFTACSNTKNGSSTVDSQTTTELITESTNTESDESGIFVDFNEDDYSVALTFEEIYEKNSIEPDDLSNVLLDESGIYYDIELNISSEDIDCLMDSTGVYVAEIDIATGDILRCGNELSNSIEIKVPEVENSSNTDSTDSISNTDDLSIRNIPIEGVEVDIPNSDDTNASDGKPEIDGTESSNKSTNLESVLVMFGDNKILDSEYLSGTLSVGSKTRTMLVKGKFRGQVALYPMLIEDEDGRVYVFKPFLEMSKAW